MCKFADENAPGWNVLAGVLCEYVELAPEVVAAKWQQLFQQEHLDIDWRIRGTIHSRMSHSLSQARYVNGVLGRTPSPSRGAIEMGSVPFGAIQGGQPQQQQRLTGADGIILPDDISEYESDPGDARRGVWRGIR
jgi:hypothetical protein